MMAIYTLVGALAASPIFTSCVENEESVSVSAQRDAKEKEREALAALKLAQIEAEKVISEANIAFEKARKAHENIKIQLNAEEEAEEKKRYELELEAIKAEQEAELKELEVKAEKDRLKAQAQTDERVSSLYEQIYDLMDGLDELNHWKIEQLYTYALLEGDLVSEKEWNAKRIQELEYSIEAEQQLLNSLHEYFDSGLANYDGCLDTIQSKTLKMKAECKILQEEVDKLQDEIKEKAYIVVNRNGMIAYASRFDLFGMATVKANNPSFTSEEDLYALQLIDFFAKYGLLKDFANESHSTIHNIEWDTHLPGTPFDEYYIPFDVEYSTLNLYTSQYSTYRFEAGKDIVVEDFLKEITDYIDSSCDQIEKDLAKLKENRKNALEADPEADVSDTDAMIDTLNKQLSELKEALEYNKTFAADLLHVIAVSDPESELFKEYVANFEEVDALISEEAQKAGKIHMYQSLIEILLEIQTDILNPAYAPEGSYIGLAKDIKTTIAELEAKILLDKKELVSRKESGNYVDPDDPDGSDDPDLESELKMVEASINHIDQLISKIQNTIELLQKRLSSIVDAQ